MKFVLVALFAITSLNSFARVLSSRTEVLSVGQTCYNATAGRLSNFGIAKYCFDFSKRTTKVMITTDGESRGMPVPGARPYTVVSEQNVQQCNSGSSAGSTVELTCEHARTQKARAAL